VYKKKAMTILDFNNLPKTSQESLLTECCGSANWVALMLKSLPFKNEAHLMEVSNECWYNQCSSSDWLEAFTHHPKIGDVKSLTEKFASTSHLTGKEQSGIEVASKTVIEKLAKANQEYESKFNFIFIVCATGKSAGEMLQLLEDRLQNTVEEELSVAMGEQQKITLLRFKKNLSSAEWPNAFISQITTHVLDTTIGKPGKDIMIQLQRINNGVWQTFAQGITNADGRIADLLPASNILSSGNYKMVFNTANYFNQMKVKAFYPSVEIHFTTIDSSHYHVPLLLNPYGYSTYRGS